MPQWKQFSGNWTVTQQAQAKGAGTWPGIPGAPTIGTATAGVGEVSVAFTAPSDTGYPTTLTFEVTSSPPSIPLQLRPLTTQEQVRLVRRVMQ